MSGEAYRKKLKRGIRSLTIKSGSINEFFTDLKDIAKAVDANKPIKPLHKIVFEDPLEMLHFLSKTKIKLITILRKHPGSIANLAKAIKRKTSCRVS